MLRSKLLYIRVVAHVLRTTAGSNYTEVPNSVHSSFIPRIWSYSDSIEPQRLKIQLTAGGPGDMARAEDEFSYLV